MRLQLLFPPAALLLLGPSLAFAKILEGGNVVDGSRHCISNHTAYELARGFAILVSQYAVNETYSQQLSQAIIAPDVVDYSNGIREIITRGCTSEPGLLNTNRDQFNANQYLVPPFEFDVQRVWHSCNEVFLQWQAPLQPRAVNGLVLLETVLLVENATGTSTRNDPHESRYSRQISLILSEFDSAAWLVDTGAFNPANCTAS